MTDRGRRRLRFGLALAALFSVVAVVLQGGPRSLAQDDAAVIQYSPLPGEAPSSVVVRVSDASRLDSLAAHAAARGFPYVNVIRELGVVEVPLGDGDDLAGALAAFAGHPHVSYVEPSYRVVRADVPSEPLYSRQSSYLNAVRAPQAWDVEKGTSAVIIAVVDTGVDVSHPDVKDRIWRNVGELAENRRDDTGSGCIDDVHGCAFVTSPSPGCSRATNGQIDDDIGHGTFVAGIAGASENGVGIIGVARNVTIMPVKVLDCQGAGDTLALARGIDYAARNGAHIINVSLGGPTDATIVREAVRRAMSDHGVVIVAATGNSGREGVAYPARYPGVIAVGAASASNPSQRASFSATGPEVAVVAVGERIVGPVPASSCGGFARCIGSQPYATGDGTSFAAPQVSGLVALMLSRQPSLTPLQVNMMVRFSADPVPPGDRANWAGSGRVNMFEAIKLVRPTYRIGAAGTTKN